MPSEWHDYMTSFIREHPGYAGRILREFIGVDVSPGATITVVPGDFNDRPSRELLPDKAVLSLAYHGLDSSVCNAFVLGMASLGSERGEDYYEYGYRIAPTGVRENMEELMATAERHGLHSPFFTRLREEGREQGREEGREQGREEGQAAARLEGERDKVLLTLDLRGLEVTYDQRQRITGCADLARLKDWAERARVAAATADIFQ